MVTGTIPAEKKRRSRAVARSLGYDFALLGLKAREARVDVIRTAAHQTAERIHDAAIGEMDHDVMLSELATSTYRLLDPRKRRRTLERVQLCIFSEEDLERQKKARSRMSVGERTADAI